jgi:probable lipoprotein NlpC
MKFIFFPGLSPGGRGLSLGARLPAGGRAINVLFFLALLSPPSGGLFAAPPLSAVPSRAVSAEDARVRVVAAAETYRGTPYRYGGADRGGLDCSGLIYLSFRDALGVSVPRTVSALYSWAEKIPEAALRPGDLVFFNTTGMVSHVGIYTGEGRFIHSASAGPKTGVMYSRIEETYWRRAYVNAGRVLPQGDRPPGDRAGKFFAEIGLGPSWGAARETSGPLRGGAGQFRLAYTLGVFDRDRKSVV